MNSMLINDIIIIQGQYINIKFLKQFFFFFNNLFFFLLLGGPPPDPLAKDQLRFTLGWLL